MKTSIPLQAASIAIACLVTASQLPAATLISYGGDYVSAATNFSRATSSNLTSYPSGAGRSSVLSFSESTVASPTSGYTGPAFYSGWYRSGANATSTTGSQQSRILNSGANDLIDFVLAYNTASAATAVSGAGTVMFLKADFTNLSGASAITLDASNPLSINFSTMTAGISGRWIVQEGSTIYVSQATLGSGASTLSSIGATNWAVFDPSSNLNFDQSSAVFGSQTFTNVTGVGYYWEGDSLAVNTTYTIDVSSFSAGGFQTVPEPHAAVLFGAGLTALLFRRKTRHVAA